MGTEKNMVRKILGGRFGVAQSIGLYSQLHSEEDYSAFSHYLYDTDPRVARNAAWVLTQGGNELLPWIQAHQQSLIDLALTTDNVALCRLTLNLVERSTFQEDTLRADFLDFCLDGMLAMENPPGVQSLCMKLAYAQCILVPELKDELRRVLEGMEEAYYKPAAKYGRRKLLQLLKKG